MVSSLKTGIKCESHNSESGRHSNLSHFIIYNKCYVIYNTVYMLYINIYIYLVIFLISKCLGTKSLYMTLYAIVEGFSGKGICDAV